MQNVIKSYKTYDNIIYTLFQERFEEEEFSEDVYGIAIESSEDKASIPKISTNFEKVNQLFNLLLSTNSYPYNLQEIVEDFVV